MFDIIKFDIEIPDELKRIATAIFISDLLNRQKYFWSIVLENPTPASYTPAGSLAVRQFVELGLINLGPIEILKKIQPILLDPNSGWDALGFNSVNDNTIGVPLTKQNKLEVINILDKFSEIFINKIITELSIINDSVEYSYGYGYSYNDLFKENYKFGYGISYKELDYLLLIT